MAPRAENPSMNPTVEDAQDETEAKTKHQGCDLPREWPEISSEHESVLFAHLEMLNLVRNHVPPDGNASRIVSKMVEKTEELIADCKVIKDQVFTSEADSAFLSRNSPELSKSRNYSNNNSNENDKTTNPTPSDPSDESALQSNLSDGMKKRGRVNTEKAESGLPSAESSPLPPLKRKRTDIEFSGSSRDARSATPVLTETEDISSEVQRRLEIKEERRSKKNNVKPEKRKRESLPSNETAASSVGDAPRHKKKRARY